MCVGNSHETLTTEMPKVRRRTLSAEIERNRYALHLSLAFDARYDNFPSIFSNGKSARPMARMTPRWQANRKFELL
jgi:hypothetical protein